LEGESRGEIQVETILVGSSKLRWGERERCVSVGVCSECMCVQVERWEREEREERENAHTRISQHTGFWVLEQRTRNSRSSNRK